MKARRSVSDPVEREKHFFFFFFHVGSVLLEDKAGIARDGFSSLKETRMEVLNLLLRERNVCTRHTENYFLL